MEFELSLNINENMNSDDISNAWDDILYAVDILRYAISNRLKALGSKKGAFDKYETEEFNTLFDLSDTLSSDVLNYVEY